MEMWLWGQKTYTIPSALSHSLMGQDVSSQLPLQPPTTMPCSAIPHANLPIKPQLNSPLYVALVMVLYPSNRKISKTDKKFKRFSLCIKKEAKSGMVAYTYNPSRGNMEAVRV